MSSELFAGIDIGATNVKYGLVTLEGEIVYRNQIATPQNVLAETLFEKVAHCGEQLLIEADDQGAEVAYIGVGSPGTVNMLTGVIQGTCPNIPNWSGFHLRDRLAERLNLPVRVDNDANCAALGEHRFGAGRGYENIICLTIGTGIGGGIIVHDRLYRGATYAAGEIGHLLVCDGPAHEEKYLETLVSSRALISRMRERLEGNITPAFKALIGDDLDKLTIRRLFTAIKRGDKVAPEVVIEAAETLGLALAGLVNVFNPELLVLGGGVTEGGSEFVDNVTNAIIRRAIPVAVESLKIVPAELGNSAGFIGAAFLDEGRKKHR